MIGLLVALVALTVVFYLLLRYRTLDPTFDPWVKIGTWNGQTYYARKSLLDPKKWPTYQFWTDEDSDRYFEQQRRALMIEERIGMSVIKPENIVTIASVY